MCGKLFKKLLFLSLMMVLLSFNLSAYWFQQSPETKTLSGIETKTIVKEIIKEVEVPVEVPVEVIREVIKEIPAQVDTLKAEEIQKIINKELKQLVIPENTSLNSELLTDLEADLDIAEESLVNLNDSLIDANKEIDYLLKEKNRTHFGIGLTSGMNLDIYNGVKYDVGGVLTLRKDSLLLLGGLSTDLDNINSNINLSDFKITAGVIYEF